jgi:hypothetical protein
LTKAHVKFLESTLVALTKTADRYDLENGNTPPASSLPRADRDAMAEFTENIRMILGTLGYPVLEPLLRQRPNLPPAQEAFDAATAPKSEVLELVFKVNNLIAHGSVTDEGFVLKKGSQLSRTNTDSAPMRVIKIKEQLFADGRLVQDGDHLVLQEDFLLSSSSYAAVMVAGTSRSGPQSWMTKDGRTLKSLEDAAVRGG